MISSRVVTPVDPDRLEGCRVFCEVLKSPDPGFRRSDVQGHFLISREIVRD